MNRRRHTAHAGSPSSRASSAAFVDDVRYYLKLSPRQLPSRYLYDPLGSALFEAICELPWYNITRAEDGLLTKYRDEVFRQLDRVSTIIELGSGSGEKLRRLVEASTRHGSLRIHTIDVSRTALMGTTQALADLDAVSIVPHETTYEDGLETLIGEARLPGQALVLFLGSNIGNFDPPGAEALLRIIRAALAAGDALLIGADLVKPEAELLLAYDDPLGVTAAFNRNLLVRINRELGGTFQIDNFDHRAVWNGPESRVEMHLVARHRQNVRIAAAEIELDLRAGEPIWTESSYKYRPNELIVQLERAGFRSVTHWIDQEHQFALSLVRAV